MLEPHKTYLINTIFQEEFYEELQVRFAEFIAGSLTIIPSLLIALVILFLTRYAVMAAEQAAKVTGERVLHSKSLRTLFIQLSRVGTWVIGVLIVCTIAFPDVGIAEIIGLLGLGSVAISFAFQDIFKNFLAGVLLLLNEPFELHDEIVVEGYSGTVEEISIRTTSLRTYQGELVVLPNAILFTNPVTVLTSLAYRRTDLSIGVDYNTPLSLALNTFADAIASVDGVLSYPEAEIDAVNFGDSSIDFLVRYWTAPTTPNVCRVQSQAIVALKAACDAADISIPYPIRTVYHYDQHDFSDAAPKSST